MKILIGTIAFWVAFLISSWALAQSTPPADSCAKTCLIHAECGIGGVCNQGVCEYQTHYCFNERWSVNSRGETSNCDAYTCAQDSGLCLRQAKKSEDCLSGYVYDGKISCVPSVQCNMADPACQDLFQRWQKARADYEAMTPEPTPPPLTCVSCDTDHACGSQQMCWKGRCLPAGLYCQVSESGEHFSVNLAGVKTSCGNYACEKVTSQCLTDCVKNADCRSGKMCAGGTCL